MPGVKKLHIYARGEGKLDLNLNFLYRFFFQKIANFSGPPYFGAPDLAPLWASPVSKKLQSVRKLFIGIYRKFQIDTPNDKKVIHKKV